MAAPAPAPAPAPAGAAAGAGLAGGGCADRAGGLGAVPASQAGRHPGEVGLAPKLFQL